MASRKAVNPFYVLLILAGIAFVLTACTYAVVMVRGLNPASVDEPSHGLIAFMDRRGMTLMLVELAVLAVGTFGAIGTENYWSRANGDAPRADDRAP